MGVIDCDWEIVVEPCFFFLVDIVNLKANFLKFVEILFVHGFGKYRNCEKL